MSTAPAFALDLNKLRLFVQICELGSLTRVAIARDSTQSLISRQIGALERECGGRLFQRTGRGVTLSPFGDQILPRVVELLASADRLASDMKSNAGTPSGEVSIALVPSLAQPLVDMLYRRVRALYPGLLLRCIDQSSGGIDELLAAGKVDLGLPFRYKRTAANEELLATVDTYLVGAPGDRLTAPETVPFSALQALPLLLPSVPNGLRVAMDQLAKRHRVSLVVAMEANSVSIQKDLAAAGTLHTILSEHAILREVEAGMLQAARIVSPGLRRSIVLVGSSHHPLSLAGRHVARLIREISQELTVQGIWQAATENPADE